MPMSYPKEVRQQAILEYSEGRISISDLMRTTGCARGTIERWLNLEGITRRGRRQNYNYHCPLLSKDKLENFLVSGRYKYNEIGQLEKLCNTCGEYWPADTEFFYKDKHATTGLNAHCIPCYQEKVHQRTLESS